jgi:NAD+ kinase
MKLNVIYNEQIIDYKKSLEDLETTLSQNNIEYKVINIDELKNYGEFSIVIGGDGTLLKAAKFYSLSKVPTLGINLGRLGFLSQNISPKEVVERILNKAYVIEERMMLISDNTFALNDFVIKGCDCSRTSKIYLEINGKEVCDYIADGLIISTPTGTTAYGLSAGGPVLHPSMDAITIVPICPHTLTARPLVVPADEKIRVKTGDKALSVSIDGSYSSQCVEKLDITKATPKAYLAFLRNERFYSVLRDKLHWGISPEQNSRI